MFLGVKFDFYEAYISLQLGPAAGLPDETFTIFFLVGHPILVPIFFPEK